MSPPPALERNADRYGTDAYEIAAPPDDFDAATDGFGAPLRVLRPKASASVAATGGFQPFPGGEGSKPPADGPISCASVPYLSAVVPNPIVAAPSAGADETSAAAGKTQLSECFSVSYRAAGWRSPRRSPLMAESTSAFCSESTKLHWRQRKRRGATHRRRSARPTNPAALRAPRYTPSRRAAPSPGPRSRRRFRL